MRLLVLILTLVACQFKAKEDLMHTNGRPKVEKGKRLFSTYGCGSCHEAQDASGNPGLIGPPLHNWKKRKYIAGKLLNTEEYLKQWIMHPQQMDPGTAMPDLGVLENEAEDIAAYLYSQ